MLARAILASPIGPAVRQRLRAADAAVRARRLTPAGGERRAVRIAVAAQAVLRGSGPEARS